MYHLSLQQICIINLLYIAQPTLINLDPAIKTAGYSNSMFNPLLVKDTVIGSITRSIFFVCKIIEKL